MSVSIFIDLYSSPRGRTEEEECRVRKTEKDRGKEADGKNGRSTKQTWYANKKNEDPNIPY